MTTVSIANEIASFRLTVMGDTAASGDRFLGWIQLKKPNGEDAGYIYLSDVSVEGRLGGRNQPDGPYVVMSRPSSEAAVLLNELARGKSMQIRYHGDEQGSGTGFLEDLGGRLDPEILAEISTRFNRDLAQA